VVVHKEVKKTNPMKQSGAGPCTIQPKKETKKTKASQKSKVKEKAMKKDSNHIYQFNFKRLVAQLIFAFGVSGAQLEQIVQPY
jgi:hypothetical protein